MIAEKSTALVPDPTGRPDRGSQITLAAICGLILAYGAFMSTNKTSNIAYLAGENAVYALFIFGAFRAFTGRKNLGLSSFAYLAIVTSLVTASLIGYARQKPSNDRVQAHISQALSSIVDASRDAQGNLKKIDTVLDTTTNEPGANGEAERFVKIYMNNMVSLRNDYVVGLQAIGFSDIMKPEPIIGGVASLLQTFRDKSHALQASALRDIDALAVDASEKADMRSGFEAGLRRAPMDPIADLLAASLSEYRAIFQLLSRSQGKWAVNNGMIQFQRDQDLAAFQAHAAVIDKNNEQELALEKASAANAQSTIKGSNP
jgi:hypothetical protein